MSATTAASDSGRDLLQERERIAEELRDVAMAHLLTLGFKLVSISSSVQGPSGDRLRDAVGDIDDIIRGLRRLAFGLDRRDDQDATHDANGLILQTLLDASAELSAPGASISVHGDLDRLPPTVAQGLGELLGGVVVSAAAGSGRGRPDITIAIGDHAIDVMISDRGAWQRRDGAGLDLVGMLDRAQHLGGRCTFTLDPDGASVAHWDIPFTPVDTTSMPAQRDEPHPAR
ncbi:sensor histidine kinase [Nocardioides sp. NPDC057577]|uniref:sensor histidine kinase n=1 Tax=unclassified Nocardioides TaxID=2615069 RepID=UPI0036593E2D